MRSRGPPGYVDDLSALVHGRARLWQAELFILSATSAAGLRVGLHHCMGAVVHTRQDLSDLRRLQLDVVDVAGGQRVTGAPPCRHHCAGAREGLKALGSLAEVLVVSTPQSDFKVLPKWTCFWIWD